MKNMIFVTLLGMVVLAGCSSTPPIVPIESTLNTAQEQCTQVKALITNKGGIEGVTIKCTWFDEVDVWLTEDDDE